jgi:hypothetical protein
LYQRTAPFSAWRSLFVTSTLAFSAKKLSFLRSKFLPYLHNVLLANKIWSKAGIADIVLTV